MARECQEKNTKGLTMMAIGMNKAAEELMILDERTQADLASGRYHDQRRGSFGTSASAPAPGTVVREPERAGRAHRRPARRASGPAPASRPWTDQQERLALLYNEQGLRPDEIAAKLGVSTYLATQIVLAARDRRRPKGPAVLRSGPSQRTRKPA
ncbi:MAG TPA: hypothetical protein VFJ07_03120 [Streptosporangiaceae bacterium]|nr:hypothetical protein [Streptosporangiaceae bacterium]